MYEMLAGQRPFGVGEVMDIALRQLEVAPPPIQELRPDVPPALARLIMRALDKDPARRFASADEMRAELGRLAHGAAARGRITTSLAAMPEIAPPVRPRAATMPPPVPEAAFFTQPIIVLPEPEPIAEPEPEPVEDGRPTLHWRVSQGAWWRRALAWLRHGPWRWRTPSST
jgi:serine/threonine protein kinase